MDFGDTIVAISTPKGIGAITIIRISGKYAFSALEQIIKTKNKIPLSKLNSHKLVKAKIFLKNCECIDNCLICVMRGPNTYTGQDTVEINCHGGYLICSLIISEIIKNNENVRLSLPGEFTKRAFLNGKMSLCQAESINEIINSNSLNELKTNADNLSGALNNKINNITEKLNFILAKIESQIDFPEEVEDLKNEELIEELEKIKQEMIDLETTYERVLSFKNGIDIAIIGNVNVGKSSLANLLFGFSKSIVSDEAGTTRDIVDGEIFIDGILFKIYDTAGIRNTEQKVEKIGVERSISQINNSRLILFVVDFNKYNEKDLEIFKMCANKEVIIIANKTDLIINEVDLKTKKYEILKYFKINPNELILTSFLNKPNEISNIIDKIRKKINYEPNEDVSLTSLRQKHILNLAITDINEAINTNENFSDVISINIENAIANLKQIIGQNVSEDVIEEIFSKFCVGK